jgi:hypothetical protein
MEIKKSVEHWWNDSGRGNGVLREREKLSLCYFVRHKSSTGRSVIEPGPVFEMPATDWLTLLYSYTHRERLVCLIIYSTCLVKVISS